MSQHGLGQREANQVDLAARIGDWNQLSADQRGALTRAIESRVVLASGEVDAWLQALASSDEPLLAADALIGAVASAVLRASRRGPNENGGLLSPSSLEYVDQIYRRLDDAGQSRGDLLRVLAVDGSTAALTHFATLVVAAPPAASHAAALPFAALLQLKEFDAGALFPRLLDALAFPQTATLVLDVANHWTRRRLLASHPASDRVAMLTDLLGQVIQRLAQLEEAPPEARQSLAQARQTVEESLALCVSLCDALGLIGDPRAIGKLRQALAIGHRRLRVEAAAALARLAEPAGFDALVELAADPASRTRSLCYLEELSSLDRARAADRAPAARAAAQLADWLGEPAQFGAPPHNVWLIDSRRMYWPGYDEPIDCRLFLYEYHARDGGLSGVGIVGPVTFSLVADLEDLPLDDIYAAFAGWQAEHEEIFETPAAEFPVAEQAILQDEVARSAGMEYQDMELVAVGHFFDDRTLIATARQGERRGVLLVEAGRADWFPGGLSRRPLGASEAYFIHKGRKLLKTFNPDGPRPLVESAETGP